MCTAGIDVAKVPGSTADVSIQTINQINSSGLFVSNFIMNGTFNWTGPLPTGAAAEFAGSATWQLVTCFSTLDEPVCMEV